MSLHQTGPLHQITGIGRTTSLTCHLPRANVFLPSAKCISSPCKMYFFRLQNAFLPIAKCISSDCKMYIFLLQKAFFYLLFWNKSLPHAKCGSCKIYFFRLQNVQNALIPKGKCSSLPVPTNCISSLLFRVSMYSMYSSSLQSGYNALAKCILPLTTFIGDKIKCKYACV